MRLARSGGAPAGGGGGEKKKKTKRRADEEREPWEMHYVTLLDGQYNNTTTVVAMWCLDTVEFDDDDDALCVCVCHCVSHLRISTVERCRAVRSILRPSLERERLHPRPKGCVSQGVWIARFVDMPAQCARSILRESDLSGPVSCFVDMPAQCARSILRESDLSGRVSCFVDMPAQWPSQRWWWGVVVSSVVRSGGVAARVPTENVCVCGCRVALARAPPQASSRSIASTPRRRRTATR